MTVDNEDTINAMKRLADPRGGDPTVIAGEIGGIGLSGLYLIINVCATRFVWDPMNLIFSINTEGATSAPLQRDRRRDAGETNCNEYCPRRHGYPQSRLAAFVTEDQPFADAEALPD